MAMNYRPLPLGIFVKGITDYPVGASSQFVEKAYNFYLTYDSKMRVRPGSTFEHTTITDTCNKLSAGINQLIPPLRRFTGEQTYKLKDSGSTTRLYYRPNDLVTAHTELTGPGGGHLFGAIGTTDLSSARYGKQIYLTAATGTRSFDSATYAFVQKIFQDESLGIKLRTASMPPLQAVLSKHGGGFFTGTSTFLFAVCYSYEYQVGDRTYITRSAPAQGYFIGNSAPASYDLALAGMDPSTDNWDSANTKFLVELYRSQADGTGLYLVASKKYSDFTGSWPSKTAVFTDGISDADLTAKPSLYTNDGTVPLGTIFEIDPISSGTIYSAIPTPLVNFPLMPRFVHVTEAGTAYRGNILTAIYSTASADFVETIYANRVYQSVPGIPDSEPDDFFVELDDDNTGISSYRGIPVFFTRETCYRGEGVVDRFGNGNFYARKIAHSSGTSSHRSIVQTPDGVFYAGQVGFYWTNGYEAYKISDSLNDTYASLVGQDNTSVVGTYDETNQRVYWAVNDTIFVLHLRYGVSTSCVFTLWGGYSSTIDNSSHLVNALPTTITTNFKATDIVMRNGILHRADSRGYVFQVDETKGSDPRVVTGVDVSTWGTSPFLHDLRTTQLDFGDRFLTKWTPQLTLGVRAIANTGDSAPLLAVLLKSDRNLENDPKTLKLFRSALLPNGLLKQNRKIPSPGLRCEYRQIYLQSPFSVLTNSTALGTALVNATTKTALLTDAVSQDWPTDLLDAYISFANDGYVRNFLITVRTADTITFTDAGNLCPASGTYAWVIRSFPKRTRYQIEDLTLTWAPMDDGRRDYQSGDSGDGS